MAIKAGNIVIGGKDQSLPSEKNTKPVAAPRTSVSDQIAAKNNPSPAPAPKSKKTSEISAKPNPKPHHEHTIKYDHNVLYVDGRPKKITKSSAYLLDMITKDLD